MLKGHKENTHIFTFAAWVARRRSRELHTVFSKARSAATAGFELLSGSEEGLDCCFSLEGRLAAGAVLGVVHVRRCFLLEKELEMVPRDVGRRLELRWACRATYPFPPDTLCLLSSADSHRFEDAGENEALLLRGLRVLASGPSGPSSSSSLDSTLLSS